MGIWTLADVVRVVELMMSIRVATAHRTVHYWMCWEDHCSSDSQWASYCRFSIRILIGSADPDTLIACQENIVLCLYRLIQRVTVLNSCPTHLSGGIDGVIRYMFPQRSRKIVIKKYQQLSLEALRYFISLFRTEKMESPIFGFRSMNSLILAPLIRLL